MNLHSRTYGAGHPLIILHGLFGSSDNWQTVGKKLGEQFRVFALDARNHGRSPHSDEFNYPAMAEDVQSFMHEQGISSAHLLGHSMGGKTAMQLALTRPELVEKLVVVDISPRAYGRQHNAIFDALYSLDLTAFTTRGQIDEALAQRIPSAAVRLFLMKNLKRNADNSFAWKMNLEVIHRHYDEVNAAIDLPSQFANPALFVKSNTSGYVGEDDEPQIRTMFPRSTIVGFDTGHWVHAEAPEEFIRLVSDFLVE
jgi:esterase